MYGRNAIATTNRVAKMMAPAPTKTAAAALSLDQPRSRSVRMNGAKVAATIAATRTEAVTVHSSRGDPQQRQSQGDRREQPPADGGEALEPARDEDGALGCGRPCASSGAAGAISVIGSGAPPRAAWDAARQGVYRAVRASDRRRRRCRLGRT